MIFHKGIPTYFFLRSDVTNVLIHYSITVSVMPNSNYIGKLAVIAEKIIQNDLRDN